jgi:hypothetical protein
LVHGREHGRSVGAEAILLVANRARTTYEQLTCRFLLFALHLKSIPIFIKLVTISTCWDRICTLLYMIRQKTPFPSHSVKGTSPWGRNLPQNTPMLDQKLLGQPPPLSTISGSGGFTQYLPTSANHSTIPRETLPRRASSSWFVS